MKDVAIYMELQTGESCSRCDCELVLVSTPAEGEVYLECDCGRWTCMTPVDAGGPVPSAA